MIVGLWSDVKHDSPIIDARTRHRPRVPASGLHRRRRHNKQNPQAGITATLAHQRKSPKGLWEDVPTSPLSSLKIGEEAKLNLDSAQTNLLEARSKVGARLNTLESTQALHEQVDVVSRQVLSELQDVDFAEAVSRLSLQTFILEAAQQSFARIANLSLFNFL